VSGHHCATAEARHFRFDQREFGRGVGLEVIDADHAGQAVLGGDVLVMPLKINQTAFLRPTAFG
jgi:hypothetical protein